MSIFVVRCLVVFCRLHDIASATLLCCGRRWSYLPWASKSIKAPLLVALGRMQPPAASLNQHFSFLRPLPSRGCLDISSRGAASSGYTLCGATVIIPEPCALLPLFGLHRASGETLGDNARQGLVVPSSSQAGTDQPCWGPRRSCRGYGAPDVSPRPRAITLGRVGHSQVCASTQHATVSHQHPVVFIPIHTACICPICAPAYPHKVHRIEIDRAAPQSAQGSGLILSRPTRLAALLRGFALPSLEPSRASPCSSLRLSLLSLDC